MLRICFKKKQKMILGSFYSRLWALKSAFFLKKEVNMVENTTQIRDLTGVFVLKDMATFQGHSVVSREIIRKPAGTMTVFAFDKDEGLSEHTAPFDAVVYLLDGEAEIRIEGKPHLVKEGGMIIMPANKPHALKAMTKFKMLLVMIK
jgi:quercetin dioxygenase-like cupin family protein